MYQSTQLFLAIVFTMSLTEAMKYPVNQCILPLEGRHGDYEVHCHYEDGYVMNINCQEHFLENLHGIKTSVPKIRYAKLENCTFSHTTNVQNSLNSMGVNITEKIVFVNFGNTPNRLNFQNLSILHLVLIANNVREIPYDLFYDVLKVTIVNIAKTEITRIPKNFFKYWAVNVSQVLFSHNNLQKIAREDFSHLVSVESIDLTWNEINEIESGAFDSLSQLAWLDLGKNRLRTVPSAIINLDKLSRFTLIAHTLGDELQIEPRNTVDLTIFQITSLPSNVFHGIYELKSITLAGHNLETIPLGVFDSNEKLDFLNLSKNGLKYLPAGIFKGLKSLTALFLAENHLTSVLPEAFIKLHSLKYLYVSQNNLTQINAHMFNYLTSIVEIDLSHNQIVAFLYRDERKLQYPFSHINSYENLNFQKLQFLNLDSNNLTDFDVIPFLVHGYINFINKTECNNGLTSSRSYKWEKNKTVDLSNNQISKVNLTGLFSAVTMLKEFKINNLEASEIGYLNIYLANNSLQCDCDLKDFIHYLNGSSHQDLKKYWMIFTRENSTFGEEFKCSSPTELQNYDVRKTRMEESLCLIGTSAFGNVCIDTCKCWHHVRKKSLLVDCPFKNLTHLPKIINSAQNCSIELNMSNNELRRIPPLDNSYLANITLLDLSSNKITEISLDVFSPNLRVLYLHNNSISRIDLKIIQYLSNDNPLLSLTIHDNKWICDCEAHKILQSSIRKKLSIYNFHEVLCHGTNRKLYEVTMKELCEDTIILIISMSLSISFLGIIIGCLAALYYRYKKLIKIWLYSRHLCLWFVTEDELDRDKKYDAFVSFSHEDEDFVEREVIAKLQAGPRPYKLCLHYRDWLAGEWIPLQISRSVAESRRTIIILTPNFLVSVWGLMEFRAAHTQALEEGRARLIVILYGELGNLDKLDQELKDYLSLNTYIKWGDPWFWQKLKYALPHRSCDSTVIDKNAIIHYRVKSNSTIAASLQSHFSSIAPCPNY